jgi:hypothetical protein
MDEMGLLVIIFLGAIVLFFLLREVICWYYKINEMKGLLTEIRDSLKNGKLNEQNVLLNNPTKENVIEPPPSPPLENNQLKIIRSKSDFGSALLVDVKIDNQKHQLENGEEIIISNIENGKHTIAVFFNDSDVRLEFEINNDNKTFTILMGNPIKIEVV